MLRKLIPNFFYKKEDIVFKKTDRLSVPENVFYTKDHFKDKPYIIGDYTYGQPEILHWGEDASLIIGKYCSIANDVKIFLGGNHRVDWISTYPFNILVENFPKARDIKGHPMTKGNVCIGNDVWIGNGVTILSGVTIGDGAVVGTSSIVTKNIQPYEIWVGNPAKLVRKRFTDIQIQELLQIKWWNWSPEKVNESVKYLCSSDIDDFIKIYNID